MTKKQRAFELYNKNSKMSRSEIIELFMKKLNMSTAGASSYYYYAKKNAEDIEPEVIYKEPDTWYTICSRGKKEKSDRVVWTNTYSNKVHAAEAVKEDEVLVEGIPDIGTPWVELTQVK